MKKITLFILIILSLSACTTYKWVDIEILSSSFYHITPSPQELIIFNYAHEQAPEVGHFTLKQDLSYLSEDRRKKIVSRDTIKIDRSTNTAIEEMQHQLIASNIFNTVNIGHEVPRSPTSLRAFAKTVQENPNSVILLLDSLSYSDNLTYFYRNKKDSAEFEIHTYTRSQWLVYYANNLTKPYHFATSENLYWNPKQVDRDSCLLQAIRSNTLLSAARITPQWINVQRIYYSGNNATFNAVDKAIEDKNWEATGPLWMSIYNDERKDSMKKGCMAFNMTLFFEMRNDLETAQMWLDTARKIFMAKKASEELNMCDQYAKVLKNSLINKEKLEQYYAL